MFMYNTLLYWWSRDPCQKTWRPFLDCAARCAAVYVLMQKHHQNMESLSSVFSRRAILRAILWIQYHYEYTYTGIECGLTFVELKKKLSITTIIILLVKIRLPSLACLRYKRTRGPALCKTSRLAQWRTNRPKTFTASRKYIPTYSWGTHALLTICLRIARPKYRILWYEQKQQTAVSRTYAPMTHRLS